MPAAAVDLPSCFVGPEATVAVLGILAALLALVGAATVFLIQATGERYSVRLVPWRLVTRRAAISSGILLALLLWVAVVALFDLRWAWTFPGMSTGLRADWGLLTVLVLSFGAISLVLVELPRAIQPEELVHKLVDPMFGVDLERARQVLLPARDVAASALARSDQETWAYLVSQVREGIADNVTLWDEAENPFRQMFTQEVRSFLDFLLEAADKHGHPSAAGDVVRLVAHLLGFSVRHEADLPRSEFVRHAVRLVRWLLDRQLYAEVCVVTKSLAQSSALEDAAPYPYALTALKQVGDWIVQEPAPRTTYLEVVYYQDPFQCLMEALSDAIDRVEHTPSYELLDEIQLVCEVILARSWKHRSCHEIQEIAYLLKRSAVLAAEQSGEYGYLLLLPIQNLHETYEELMRKGCTDSARQVVEEMAEVVANGFRPGLKSQVGASPGRHAVDTLVECEREMVIHGSREIYTRGHYLYIPESARRQFTRMVQDKLADYLGFTGPIELDENESK